MQAIDQDFLIRAIKESTDSVFSMMLDAELQAGVPGLEVPDVDGGLVSLVGLTGPWSGTGSFCCTSGVACRLAARMLGMEAPVGDSPVTDEVMDAIAELTNMIVGNIKNAVEDRVGPMAINIPTVVYGRNFHFRSLPGGEGISVPFEWGADLIQVRLCIAPATEKTSFGRHKPEILILQRA